MATTSDDYALPVVTAQSLAQHQGDLSLNGLQVPADEAAAATTAGSTHGSDA